MDAAAAGDDDRFLARHQPFGTGGGVAERLTGAGDQIEVDFQLRRDVEVVHRGADDQRVVRLQLGNQLIGQRQGALLMRRQRVVAGGKASHHFAIQLRQRWVSQVAHGERVFWVSFMPLFNKKID